jgi:hypothetical protein
MRYLKLVLFAMAISIPTSYACGGEITDKILREKTEREKTEAERDPYPRYSYPKAEISLEEQIYDYYLARGKPFGQYFFDMAVRSYPYGGSGWKYAQGVFKLYREEGGTDYTDLAAFRLGIAREAGARRKAKP